jgi:CheY-like chemotaxis protein
MGTAQPPVAKRILVVEDNPSDVYLLRRALDEHGVPHTIDVIRDGEQALKYAERAAAPAEPAPDLIVMDLNLPRYDGIEVLSTWRNVASLQSIPILVLTSSDSPKERQRAEELGVSDFVRKPIMLDEFMAVGGRIKALFDRGPTDS